MPLYSQVTYTGNGSTVAYAIPFSYIDSTHIKAYLNGTITTAFTVSTSTLTFTTAPANGVTIRIERQTPIDARLVDFSDGSVLTEADLDKSANQNFFVAQEITDDQANNLSLDTDDKYNANSKIIKNLANPVSANDAVNKTYLEDTWLTTADKAVLTNLNSNIASVNAVNSALTNVNAVGSDLLEPVSEINTVAVSIANVDTVGTNIANVNTVAGNNANINTVAGANANITTVAGANTNITAVAGQITPTNNISTVAGAVANIATVASANTNIGLVAGQISPTNNIATVAGANANITTVAGANTNIGTVATNIANVNTVGGAIANVNTVATNVANVNSVASNSTNINTVAGNNTNINTVAGISADITTVATNAGNISTVASDIAKVITAANDLNEAVSEIDTVANAITNVDNVGNNIANVNTVATNIANINAVNSNSTNINAVNSNSANINSVASNSANINTVATDIANVNTVATNVASVNSFANVYRISATAPSTSLDAGDLWFDTTANKLKVYGASGFELAGSSVNGTSNRFIFNATASQTTFSGADANSNTLAYDTGYIDVYLNGIRLNPADYTATDGSSIVLTTGASSGDILYVVAFGTFSLANINANDISSGTLNSSRLPTVPTTKGGTGLTTIGTANQYLKVNSGATGLEYGTVDLTNLNASNLTSGTVPSARLSLTSSDLPTVPTTKGGTGLTTIGTANQVLRVNSGATALEYGTIDLTNLNATNLTSGTVPIARLGSSGTASSSTYLRGDNTWASAGASAGQVIQVLSATDTTQRNTTSTSFVTASNTLSVSITPASTSNKIFIIVSSTGQGGGDTACYTVYRGATNLTGAAGFTQTYNGGVAVDVPLSMTYLDSPSTTSATTYQVYFKSFGGVTGYLNRGGSTGVITVMEVKG